MTATRWTCPRCQRRFGRHGQGHECAPAMTLEAYLSTGPPHEKPVVEAVLAHVATMGDDVVVEPVSVGVLVKRSRTFVELRPMVRWEAVWFVVSRTVHHARVARRLKASVGRTAHCVNVRAAAEVDEVLLDWITEAYLDTPP